MCNCKECQRGRRIKAALDRMHRLDIEREFDLLLQDHEADATERAVLQSVMEGNWPGAVRRLEAALVKARIIETESRTRNGIY